MILLTAFEPFGPIRGPLGENASREVLEALRSQHGAACHYLVLPVDDEGIAIFTRALDALRPSGVLSMGEHGRLAGDAVVLEPLALECPVTGEPDFSDAPEIPSPFAQSIGAKREDSSIGRYYCNAAYRAALTWARDRGTPVAFVHVPVDGDRQAHVKQVDAILAHMLAAQPTG